MVIEGKKILLTGGRGFIGSRLETRFREMGADVMVYDISDGHDVTDHRHIAEFPESDIVCHLAALLYVPDSWKQPQAYYAVNAMGTVNMLEYCRTHHARMILASSYIYGIPEYFPIDECHPLRPNNPYTHSKFIAEKMCQFYSVHFGIPCTILRPFNVYGATLDGNLLIPTILRQIKACGRIEIGDPKPARDWLYIDDLIDAYVQALRQRNESCEVFNIGSGKSHSVKEIAECIRNIYGRHISIQYTHETRINEIDNVVADTRKARQTLGWAPKTSLEEGLYLTMRDLEMIS